MTPILLRPAGIDDAALLHGWANHPSALSAKLETDAPIPWDSHVVWLTRRLDSPRCRIWIVERDGRAVGQLRFEDKGAGYEIDIFVAPDARGRGVAAAALARGLAAFAAERPAAPPIARVRVENAASRRLFEAAGFERIARAADADTYRAPDGAPTETET